MSYNTIRLCLISYKISITMFLFGLTNKTLGGYLCFIPTCIIVLPHIYTLHFLCENSDIIWLRHLFSFRLSPTFSGKVLVVLNVNRFKPFSTYLYSTWKRLSQTIIPNLKGWQVKIAPIFLLEVTKIELPTHADQRSRASLKIFCQNFVSDWPSIVALTGN